MPAILSADQRDFAGFAVADGADAGHTLAMHQYCGERWHVIMPANGLEKALKIIGQCIIRGRIGQIGKQGEK